MLLKALSQVTVLSLGLVPFSGQFAFAEEHTIVILKTTYFPSKTAVEAGDTLRFVNASGSPHTVAHMRGAWTTGAMRQGQEVLIRVEPHMTGRFEGWTTQRIAGHIDLMRDPLAD